MPYTALFLHAVYGLLSLIETYILWFFFDTFLHRNERRARFVPLGQLCYFVFQYATYYFELPLFSSAVPTFLIAIILSAVFFRGDFLYKVLTVYIFIFLFYACRLLSFTCFLQLNEGVHVGNTLPVLESEVQAVACVLALLFTHLLKTCQNLRMKGHMIFYNAFYGVAPAVMLASMIVLFMLELSGAHRILSYDQVTTVCLFMMTVILFYHLDKMTIINEKSVRTQLAMSLLEEDKSRYSDLIAQQQETLRIKHDIRQHLTTLQYMLENHETEEARQYLDKVLEHRVLNNHLFTTGNTIIDSLISARVPNIKAHGIDIKFNLMIPPTLPVDDMDLCVLLSNLLINAQEACERMEEEVPKGQTMPEKTINLDMTQKKNFLFIHVSNTYSGRLILENGRYRSTKKNAVISGIGLSNIGLIVDKYGGVMEITPEENTFHVRIMLPM